MPRSGDVWSMQCVGRSDWDDDRLFYAMLSDRGHVRDPGRMWNRKAGLALCNRAYGLASVVLE